MCLVTDMARMKEANLKRLLKYKQERRALNFKKCHACTRLHKKAGKVGLCAKCAQDRLEHKGEVPLPKLYPCGVCKVLNPNRFNCTGCLTYIEGIHRTDDAYVYGSRGDYVSGRDI